MPYGLSAFSNSDNSLVISSSTLNNIYIGKATSISDTVYQFNNTSIFPGMAVVKSIYKVPNYTSSVPPTIFTSVSGVPHKGAFYQSGGYWYTELWHQWRDGVYETSLDVYCFAAAPDALSATTGGYGVQLFNSSGVCTYDSNWEKKVLTVKHVVSQTVNSDNKIYLNGTVSKPAVCNNNNHITHQAMDIGRDGVLVEQLGIMYYNSISDFVGYGLLLSGCNNNYADTGSSVYGYNLPDVVAIIDGADYD